MHLVLINLIQFSTMESSGHIIPTWIYLFYCTHSFFLYVTLIQFESLCFRCFSSHSLFSRGLALTIGTDYRLFRGKQLGRRPTISRGRGTHLNESICVRLYVIVSVQAFICAVGLDQSVYSQSTLSHPALLPHPPLFTFLWQSSVATWSQLLHHRESMIAAPLLCAFERAPSPHESNCS